MRVGIGIGATFVTTKAAGGAPINTIAPSVTTTGKIGSGVTGSAGTWTGATSYTYQHQVYDDLNATWIDMTGETGLNVTSISSDNLSTARLAVTATGPGGSTTAYSDTYTITYVAPVITNVGSISGTYTVGQTLVHTGLVYTGTASVVREWMLDSVVIATGSSVLLTEAMADGQISINFDVQNSGGSDTDSITGSTVTRVAPVAGADQDWIEAEGTGSQSFDVKPFFTGTGITYTITGGSNASLSIASGVLSVNTGDSATGGGIGPKTDYAITVTGTNSGGSDSIVINLDVTERALGTNLVTNPDFTSGTSSWLPANSGTITNPSGTMHLTAGAANSQARQSNIAVTNGAYYRVAVRLLGGSVTSGTPSMRVGTSAGGTQYGNITTSSPQLPDGRYYTDFLTTGTGVYLAANVPTLGDDYGYDDVSLRAYVASTVPAAMVDGNWSATSADLVSGDVLTLSVSTAPSDGGSSITKYQYRLNGGTWTDFSPAMTGTSQSRSVTCPTWETAVNVEMRAYNANGGAPASDVKSRTPHFGSMCRFVSPSGSASNDGSYASPWTIAKALSSTGMSTGQTCYAFDGTYTTTGLSVGNTTGSYASGSEADRITYRTLPGHERLAVFTGSGFAMTGKSWLTFQGLRIQGTRNDGASPPTANIGNGFEIHSTNHSTPCGHIKIIGCQIATCSNSGVFVSGAANMGTSNTCPPDTYSVLDITIDGNDISDTNYTAGGNECISLGNGTDTFRITRNDIHDSQQYGIDPKLGARNGVIADNRIWNMEKHGIYMDAACRTLENIDVYRNKIWDCGTNGITIAREAARGTNTSAATSPDSIGGYYQNVRNIRAFMNEVAGCRRGILLYQHANDVPLRRVPYDNATNAQNFNAGDTITTSAGGSGQIGARYPATSTTGVLYVIGSTGTWADNNTLTASGASAQINGTSTASILPGDFDDVWVFHNSFIDSTDVEPGGEGVEFSGVEDIVEGFKFGNNIIHGNPDATINDFTASSGYASGGNVTSNPTFANRNASPPDLTISVGSSADGAGSSAYSLATLLSGETDYLGNSFTTDLVGNAWANPPAAGAREAA